MDLMQDVKCDTIVILPEISEDFDKEPFLSSRRAKAREIAISKGFDDEYHREGFLYFNRLNSEQYTGYDVDVLNFCEGGSDY